MNIFAIVSTARFLKSSPNGDVIGFIATAFDIPRAEVMFYVQVARRLM